MGFVLLIFGFRKLKRPRDSRYPYSISKSLNTTGSFRNTLDFIFHVMDSSNIEYSCIVYNREQSKENVRISPLLPYQIFRNYIKLYVFFIDFCFLLLIYMFLLVPHTKDLYSGKDTNLVFSLFISHGEVLCYNRAKIN